MLQIKLDLKPLSTNKAWQGRRFKSPDYKQFEQDMLYLLPRCKKVSGEVEIFLRFYVKNYKMVDADNFEKTLFDCLVKGGIIDDDRFIICHHNIKFPALEDRMEIDIVPLSPVK